MPDSILASSNADPKMATTIDPAFPQDLDDTMQRMADNQGVAASGEQAQARGQMLSMKLA